MYKINDIVEITFGRSNIESSSHKAKIVSIEANPIPILTQYVYRLVFEKPYADCLISCYPNDLEGMLKFPGFHIIVSERMLKKASVASSIDYKTQGLCPECGHKGEWRALALICPVHGKFAG